MNKAGLILITLAGFTVIYLLITGWIPLTPNTLIMIAGITFAGLLLWRFRDKLFNFGFPIITKQITPKKRKEYTDRVIQFYKENYNEEATFQSDTDDVDGTLFWQNYFFAHVQVKGRKGKMLDRLYIKDDNRNAESDLRGTTLKSNFFAVNLFDLLKPSPEGKTDKNKNKTTDISEVVDHQDYSEWISKHGEEEL